MASVIGSGLIQFVKEKGGGGETRNKKTQQMTVVWFVKSEV